MRFRFVSTAVSLLAVAPGVSLALGLGDIQLKSTLNAPLNAEIELIATAEELNSLRAQIASRDTFSRYGLEFPSFVAGIQVRPVRLADGRHVIQLTSTAPMTEPFATLLVEASWARGRNLREYTVLFDPPAFAPAGAAASTPAAPVAAAIAGAGERSATIARPAAPAPVAPSPAAGARANAAEYVVRSGDSLSAIARNQFGAGEAERAMIAIYRGNQNAFDGNINRLRSGAVLRLPDNAGLAAVDPREAAAEVRRQSANWAGAGAGVGATVAADPRLRLVPPASAGADGSSSGETQALRDRVASLESELVESRRLLALRNAELARLQGSAATAPPAKQVPPAAPTQPVAAVKPEAQSPAVESAPVAPEPVVKKPAKVAKVSKVATASLLERLTKFWYVPVGALLAVLLIALGLRAARSRRKTTGDSLSPFAVGTTGRAGRDTSSDTLPLRKQFAAEDDPSILVEESGTHERPNFAHMDSLTVDLDDASASMSIPVMDATAALEQGDPLAEADFHMAYGLYDQAADLVKLAIHREPARRDLKLKLLEVFFVWGNKDQFLQIARELADTRDESAPGEWEKVIIMGKQLAPEDALFSQSYSGVGPASVDLNLEGGQNLIDFDLQGEPSVSMSNDGAVDMNFGTAFSGNELPGEGLVGLDFMLDDPARGDDLARTATTRQMAQPGFADVDVDAPTVEQPTLDDVADTLIGKIDAHTEFLGSDQTAELSIDDLGLDLGRFDATGTNLLDDSQLAQALEDSDAPTLVAGMDETSRRLISDADNANQPTELLPLGEYDSSGATSRVSVLDLEFDVDSNAETGKRSALEDGDFNLDLDVGSPDAPADGEYQRTQRIEPVAVHEADLTESDLEPVTMSEVGTKLDLARAYMDMGDPDGARSILREVLQEGSPNQRQEAQRLIDSIPG